MKFVGPKKKNTQIPDARSTRRASLPPPLSLPAPRAPPSPPSTAPRRPQPRLHRSSLHLILLGWRRARPGPATVAAVPRRRTPAYCKPTTSRRPGQRRCERGARDSVAASASPTDPVAATVCSAVSPNASKNAHNMFE
jgi:hypothetical protein